MGETMFMAFAMEQNDYDERVKECAQEIINGTPLEEALGYYDVEYADVQEIVKFYI